MKLFDLKVGFECQNNCIHCVVGEKTVTRPLTTEKIFSIIESVQEGIPIVITGGEPTIREDFLQIVERASRKNHVVLQTNGVMFSDKEFLEKTSCFVDTFLMAIHSADSDVHDKIVSVPGQGVKVKQALENMKELELQLITQTVISKVNLPTLKGTYDYIQSVYPGIRMNLTYPHPNGHAYKNWKWVVPKYSEIKEEIQEILKTHGELINTEAIPKCYLYPYHEAVFDMDEDMIKSEVREGLDPSNKNNSYFDKDGRTNNYNASILGERRKGPKCKECIFNERCIGVWKEYIEFYGKEFDLYPVKEKSQFSTEWGSLIIDGSKSCLNRCVFCNGVSSFLGDEKELIKTLHNASAFIHKGIKKIEISGGDPGEFRYLPSVISYLKRAGTEYITLSTHGRTLKDKELVHELKACGLKSVRIPLYGITEEAHNSVVQRERIVGNAFKETMEGIKNIVEAGLDLMGYTAITKQNKNELPLVVQKYKEIAGKQLKHLYLGVVFIADMSDPELNNWYLPIKDASKEVRAIVKELKQLQDVDVRVLDIPYCVIGEDLKFAENCNHFPNLGTQEIDKSNQSDDPQIPFYRLKSHIKQCVQCSAIGHCVGFSKNEIQLFGDSQLKHI